MRRIWRKFNTVYRTRSQCTPHLHALILQQPGFLVHLNRGEHAHRRHRHLRWQRLIRLAQLAQQLEIVDVERGRGGEEDPRFLIAGIAESMRCTNWHNHIVARLGVDDLLIFTSSVWVWNMEADYTLRDVESLVVHFVPVRWRSWCPRRQGEFCYSQAIVCDVSAVYIQRLWVELRPVREPSSMIRHVIGPSLKVSPALMGTKLIFSSGIGTTPAMLECRDVEVLYSQERFKWMEYRRLGRLLQGVCIQLQSGKLGERSERRFCSAVGFHVGPPHRTFVCAFGQRCLQHLI